MTKVLGVTLRDRQLSYERESGPLRGAKAMVDSSPGKGWSLATGFLGARRGHEYLMIEGEGFGWVIDVPHMLAGQARNFAMQINVAAATAEREAANDDAVPADWYPDPDGDHEFRWWDGEEWTEHVSDRGVQSPPS